MSPVPREPLPDVVLITVDTLRADAVGFAGNPNAETPVLDRLAASGRVFTRAHAHNVVTLPSHANILTGLHPYQHGVRDNSGFRLPDTVPTLATRLREAGYVTGAFVGAYPLDSQYGLDRGFDVYDDHVPEGSRPNEFVLPERRGDEVVRLAREWWTGRTGEPRFLWVHLYDPHAPYTPPEPWAGRFAEAPYLGEVAAADAFLEPLLDEVAGKALVVFTSDHGEALGDHGELTHGLFAYEATLRVPLVIAGPGIEPGRSDTPAAHVDIVPTVLDALGLDVPPELPGRSLLRATGEPPPTYFESLSANLNRGWAPLRGVLGDGHKLISLPVPELYDLAGDPGEEHNRSVDRRPLLDRLRSLLPDEDPWPPSRTLPGARPSVDGGERLRSLGYLAGSAPPAPRYGPDDDPKNLVALDRKLHRIIASYSEGRLDDAVALGREVVEERPSMAMGHSLLAQALLESGATAAALEVMRGARERGVAGDTLLRQLALTLAEVGKAGEALEILRPPAGGDDVRTLAAYGLVLSEAGRQGDARAVLERLLALDPDSSTAFEHLCLVHLRTGEWRAARTCCERALELNPELPRAWNHLGVALFELAEAPAAVDAWQRAVDLDPGLFDAFYNLGTRSLELDRPEQALAALERFVAAAPEERYGDDLRRARVLLNRLQRQRKR